MWIIYSFAVLLTTAAVLSRHVEPQEKPSTQQQPHLTTAGRGVTTFEPECPRHTPCIHLYRDRLQQSRETCGCHTNSGKR